MNTIDKAGNLMPGALSGIRAVEWATFGNGPIIGVMLGDLGAEVIKLEDRVAGDPSRGISAFQGVKTMSPQGINYVFEFSNRNKKSIRVDLNKPKGKEIIYKLTEKSDVFYTNYRKSVAVKQGVDYETLAKHNPRLVYGRATGLGPEGPDCEKRAFDPVGLARSGLMTVAGEKDSPPGQIAGAIVDTLGATMTAFGIVSALFMRERTGEGQEVNASLLGSAMWSQFTNISLTALRDHTMGRYSRTAVKNPLANVYQCKDKKWIALAEPQSDRYWQQFCNVMGIPHLEKDPKFADEWKRRDNAKELVALLDKLFTEKTRDQWAEIFREQGKRFVAWECVQSIPDLFNDPQVIANRYIVEYDHPVLGKIKVQPFPIGFSKATVGPKGPAPEFGQHTEEVLLDIGYTWEDIERLRDDEVI
ncbi:MAG: CoA transferase [Deltaproteobacteria bacterium]|nr:CoA transferase [Deltaproteobacteria bacterium]